MASDFPSNPQISSQQSGTSIITQLEMLKSKLHEGNTIQKFQLAAIKALQDGKDTIVVQPTGSGKSLCYIASALMNPGKITLVVEPVVAVITNQIQNLKCKGIDAFALGRAAGKCTSTKFSRAAVTYTLLHFALLSICFGHQQMGSTRQQLASLMY